MSRCHHLRSWPELRIGLRDPALDTVERRLVEVAGACNMAHAAGATPGWRILWVGDPCGVC